MSNESNFAPEKTGAKLFHRKDLYLALVLVAFGAFVYYEAGKFPPAPAVLGDTVNADVFPKILVVILLFLTAIIPFEFKMTPEKVAKIDKDRDQKTLPITWITIFLLLTIVFLTDFLGAVLTMFVICLLLPIVWGEKNYVAVAIYALLFPAFVWFLFNQLLGLYFAPGLLEVFLK
jgi:putative tricarboxylic transport membrane protein